MRRGGAHLKTVSVCCCEVQALCTPFPFWPPVDLSQLPLPSAHFPYIPSTARGVRCVISLSYLRLFLPVSLANTCNGQWLCTPLDSPQGYGEGVQIENW